MVNIEDSGWIAGDKFSMADACTLPYIQRLDHLALSEAFSEEKRPKINKWYKKVKDLNLINHCYFPGNIDHQKLLNKYKNHEVDVVVSASISIPDIFEGIPVSLMEAMSYEIPVIATDSGGTKELVDNESGILVNQNDSEALLNAIISLRNNPEYRRKISKSGRIKIKRDFDTMKNARDLISLF